MWNEVLPRVFSGRGNAGSLSIIVDSCLGGLVILTEYYRSLRNLRSSFCRRPMMLVFLSVCLIPQVSRAAFLWTTFSRLTGVSDAESQAAEAYSKTGRTSCL